MENTDRNCFSTQLGILATLPKILLCKGSGRPKPDCAAAEPRPGVVWLLPLIGKSPFRSQTHVRHPARLSDSFANSGSGHKEV